MVALVCGSPFVFVRAMSSPTDQSDLPANFFELLSECQGLALKLWSAKPCFTED